MNRTQSFISHLQQEDESFTEYKQILLNQLEILKEEEDLFMKMLDIKEYGEIFFFIIL